MKTRISNYIFNPTAYTVVFVDYTIIDVSGILLITNVVNNQIIYNFADPLLGGTVSGNTLTLTYNTSAMSSTDGLQIFYEDPALSEASDEMLTILRDQVSNDDIFARRVLQLLRPLANIVSGTGRISIDVGSFGAGTIGTVTNVTNVLAVTAVGTVNNVANVAGVAVVQTVNALSSVGGLNGFDLMYNVARTGFADCIRRNITF